ncbi:NIDO and EGF 3 and EGF CA domain containing prote in, partial [Trichuris trichiura]
ITKDGALGFSPSFTSNEITAFPIEREVIAVFWTETSFGNTGQVHFRETADPHVLSIAARKVRSQFRLDDAFSPSSVLVVTWEKLAPNSKVPPSENDQVMATQLAWKCYGSQLSFPQNVGFNKGDGRIYFKMPWSGSSHVLKVKENSNIGIPGEWLFKLDDPSGTHLCAPGVKGLHCFSKCEKNEFSYDCAKRCYCAQDEECNHITGRCPSERCKSGWTNAPSCDIDIDECSAVTNPCPDVLPDCRNKPGTYECECLPIAYKPQQISEFVYNPFRPVPLRGVSYRNKILTQSGSALPIKSLPNTWPGWMLPEQRANSKSILCIKQCNQNSHCALINGAERCECNTGWTGDGNYCVDINECLQDNPCPINAKCINTNGSYDCQCPVGFISNGIACTDVDECAEGTAQCPEREASVCVNTNGSYVCQCREGYNGEPGSEIGCIDINECLLPHVYCGPNSECTNTVGSYACECHVGFQPNTGGTNGCEDVDECQTKPCSKAATCTNNPGSFKCTCNISGNGVIGFDSPITTYKKPMDLGNTVMPFYHKVDLEKGGKIYIRTLTNGTFLSELITFFREVEGLRALKVHQVIIVTYENAGIQASNVSKSVYLPFSRSNAYELTVKSNIGTPGKWIYRVDLEYIPACPSGYSDAPLCLSGDLTCFAIHLLTKSFADINECRFKEFACHKHAICINTPGSYVCQCKRGYSGDGRQCFYIDACYTETGAVCGDNAQCFVPAFHRSKPECVCNDGFIGDGFFCTASKQLRLRKRL